MVKTNGLTIATVTGLQARIGGAVAAKPGELPRRWM